jgi:MarR family transcriptional regulator for hemolysin
VLRYDFEQSLLYSVCSTSLAMERALNEELAPHGITYRQWQVLGWLVLEGPLPQGELADRMRIEPPTLVGIVDRMERDGWLERSPCPEDRRRKLLRLTDRVEPVWERIASAARRVRSRAAEGFSDDDLHRLFAGLERVRGNLTRPNPSPGSETRPAAGLPPMPEAPSSVTPPPTPALAEDPRS